MEWLKFFLISTILNYSHGADSQGCTLFQPKNLGSFNASFISSLLDPIRDNIPIFNNKTVPNISDIIKEYTEATNSEDVFLNTTEILTKYGYKSEQHQVQTSDGYFIKMFRIPGYRSTVLINPGILCSSDVFIATGPKFGLPYMLADLGYDVWLGNARGNNHGRKHITLTPDCAEFWQFSWHEIGTIDVPNMIDYVLEKTNKTKLAFIGHSQGTTTYFVMASEKPEYNDKISVMISLSAVSYLSHSESPLLQIVARIEDPIYALTKVIGLYEFLPRNQLTTALTSIACETPVTATIFCNSLAFLFTGPDISQINPSILPSFFSIYPAGASTKQLVHFGQLINSGRFCQYDYGVRNLEKYGAAIPPDYPVEKITSKVVNFYSDNDGYFSAPADRAKFLARLPNLVEQYRVPYAQFSHMDFLYARDVKELVYDKILEILPKYV